MYFGILVAQARHEQQSDTWQRDMASLCAARQSRLTTLMQALRRLFA
jgi:hypothetical protein